MTATAADDRRAPLRICNLHNTLPQLAGFAVSALEQEAWLDSYLLAGGISQLLDDQLELDPLSLRRVSSYLAKDAGSAGRVAALALTRPAAGALARVSAMRPSAGTVQSLAAIVAHALDGLADLALGHEPPPDAAQAVQDLTRASQLLAARSTHLPDSLVSEIARLPACFRSFDQHPDDLRSLAREIASGDSERDAPQLVVGIRTSGSYLAPLLASSLRAEGYRDLATLTMRPGRRPSAAHRRLLRASNTRGGRVIVCDDPPGTGSAIAGAVAQLAALGVAPERIVLALALFPGVDQLPDSLSGMQAVLLPYEKWTIHERMAPETVRQAVSELLGDGVVVSDAQQLSQRLPRNGRGHVRATYTLAVRDEQTETTEQLSLAVESVGIGYFGTHALAIAEQIGDFLPNVLGVRDGLLYRTWLPEEENAERLLPAAREALAARIAAYAFARNQRLALDEDFTLRQSGQYPAWEAASTVLSRAFGRGWPAGRALTTDRAVKQLLHVRNPSVIDGRVELRHWFAGEDPNSLVKVDWDQGDSWNLGLSCCDPVFDLAGVTAERNDPLLARELRNAYESLAAAPVDDERWLLYELAHLSAPDAPPEARHELGRARSRALQRYFQSVYFADLAPASSGPLCGLDLDGVLETEHLGFPALTPASAAALRALIAHGFRPLLVTGRSLSEVIERCSAYGLAGGAAEYGCVTFDASSDRVEVLIDAQARRELERLRAELREREGVTLDDDYSYAIRAFIRDPGGRRGPLPADLLADAARSAGAEEISRIVGDAQTDIVDADTDKGRGVLALAAALGAEGPAATPLAFAVGDTETDLPLVRLAERPFAPAHAAAALGGVCTVTRSGYQRGFAEAVAALIGHAPGGCADCAIASPSPRRQQLLKLLAIGERGIGRLPIEMASLRYSGVPDVW
jgi:hydroxymethylpyrimidine pyrophosphatase-like HAD family hydrolase